MKKRGGLLSPAIFLVGFMKSRDKIVNSAHQLFVRRSGSGRMVVAHMPENKSFYKRDLYFLINKKHPELLYSTFNSIISYALAYGIIKRVGRGPTGVYIKVPDKDIPRVVPETSGKKPRKNARKIIVRPNMMDALEEHRNRTRKIIPTIESILAREILVFISQNQMPHSTFGRLALGDGSFFKEIAHEGRSITQRTAARVRFFMDNYDPDNYTQKRLKDYMPERHSRTKRLSS